MKQFLILLTGFLVAGIAVHCTQNSTPNAEVSETEVAQMDSAALVKRGAYLVNILVCDDCHTPKKMTEQGPEPDLSRRLMGHPAEEVFTMDAEKSKLIKEQHVAVFSSGLTGIAGPWGVSYAANLTPDDTGTGNWTFEQFKKAIREGKSKGLDGTRPILPPMPWQQYRMMSDEDLKAIFTYIQSLPPLKNVVPGPVPPTL